MMLGGRMQASGAAEPPLARAAPTSHLRCIPIESLDMRGARFLGEGSFGAVHIAQLHGADVAVKTLLQPSDEASNSRATARAHVSTVANACAGKEGLPTGNGGHCGSERPPKPGAPDRHL